MDPVGYGGTSVKTPNWTIRARSLLAEFSDFFSEFGRYISPTYRHDRCERSVQMRLYTLNKRHFALVFLVFVICFTVTVIIGLAGPPVMEFSEQNSSSLALPPTDSKKGPFVLRSPPLSTFNQQVWLTARLHINFSPGGRYELPFSISVQVRGLLEEGVSSETIYGEEPRNHSRTLRCAAEGCEDIILLHLGFLAYPHYVVTVLMYGLDTVSPNSVVFTFTRYNASFTQLEIWMRFSFLVAAFFATCLFAHSLRKFAIHDWSIEQKWMTILLPLLLLYNNPVFPLSFLVNSWVPTIVDTVFQVTFIAALLLYWLCLYHGVRQTRHRVLTFYVPKIVVVGALWLMVVSLACWQQFKQLQDPTYDYQFDTSYALGVKIAFAVIAGLYILYLVFLLVRAYAELRGMPYFDLRLKFMTALMVIVFAVSITITILRFGVNPLWSDHFIPELSTHYHNSAMFAAFYALLNFYMFTMAFVYSPSKNAVFESHFKDNPALSMLNDSDEEVVYGSEETSLTRIKTGNRYDSDEEAFN